MRTRISAAVAVAAALLAAAALAGCSGARHAGADKAGGSNAPIVLRLATNVSVDQGGARAVRYFASQVDDASGGRLRVHVVFEAAGRGALSAEPDIARKVRGGAFDLGWIPTRAWDELGIKPLRALQAPFLVTSYTLADRVVAGPIGRRLLRSIAPFGVVGLALVPDLLQHPFGASHPLVTPADFAGTRLRVHPSRVTDAILRALGGRPVHVPDSRSLIGVGKVDGLETEFPEEASSPYVATANVVLFAKVDTLFANARAFGRLGGDLQAALRDAARQTVDDVVRKQRSEALLVRAFCKSGGQVATATASTIARLERVAQPVVAQLRHDPETAAAVREIRAVKASTPPAPAIVVPHGCAPGPAPRLGGKRRPPSLLNGTYRYTLTQAGANAFGPPITGHNNYPVVVTVALSDGGWSLRTDELDTGTYSIRANRVAFRWSRLGYTDTFTFTRDRNGTLNLKPLLPMDRGDQFVWADAAWRRIGPPTKLSAP